MSGERWCLTGVIILTAVTVAVVVILLMMFEIARTVL